MYWCLLVCALVCIDNNPLRPVNQKPAKEEHKLETGTEKKTVCVHLIRNEEKRVQAGPVNPLYLPTRKYYSLN